MESGYQVPFSLEQEKQHVNKFKEIINTNDFINLAIYLLLYAVWERVIKKSIRYIAVNITKQEGLYIGDLNNDLQQYIIAKLIVSNKNKAYIDIQKISLSTIKLERLLESNIDIQFDSLKSIAKYYQYFGLDLHSKIRDKNYHEPIRLLCRSRNKIAHGEILHISYKDESRNIENIIVTIFSLFDIIQILVN